MDNHALDGLFPPRKLWLKFRPRKRDRRQDSMALNLQALKKAISILRVKQPTLPWAIKLSETISRIRRRVLEDASFSFGTIIVRGIEKDKKLKTFRPLAEFGLEDKIIDCLTARYFRERFDNLFGDCALAFRCASPGQPVPTIHTALAEIHRFRLKYSNRSLFVAEADISAFYDSVSHKMARHAITSLESELSAKIGEADIAPRAKQIFEAFLNAYSFFNSVKKGAEVEIKRRNQQNSFPWPEQMLRELHGKEDLTSIGVPQGAALSCFVANAVLHSADQSVLNLKKRRKRPLLYQRYCDDMVVVSTDRAACRAGFEAYLNRLHEIKLPVHPPKTIAVYDPQFWNGKSKAVYQWAEAPVGVPWIQFVGYQIRFDGLVRIRPKSLKKHFRKIVEMTNFVLKAIRPGKKSRGHVPKISAKVRKRKRQIVYRLAQRLCCLGVGRRFVGQPLPTTAEEIMPMCWTRGFRGLKGMPAVKTALKELDRHRERQLRRLKRNLAKHVDREPEAEGWLGKKKPLEYLGRPFSYFGQLK